MDTLFFHPKVVHIPIALGVLMPLLAGGVLLAWWRSWLPARSWLLVVALQAVLLGSGIVALQTGEAEEDRVERVVPELAIEEHEEAAELFVAASGGVLTVMLLAGALGARRSGLPTAAAATLGTLVVLGLGYRTGQAGGSLVYEHGAAQAYSGSVGSGTGARTVSPGHDDDD
ncbi:MAG TPA: hypothetical protein VFU02_05550 [Polyangiaceae bacterium]|nr:hypothetical protein [Polyangiaceae bacterium]